ncbi:hypothetical protein OUZ56_027929 [Daphnia magna]|uniref:Uncharacterized protein n=1 Tax=Daphnia magna TaxID=35525 RepID=A0ABR0B2C7_9CRUS|nr:hypothetical protein OUZ56_027929 [Daphnia magna]
MKRKKKRDGKKKKNIRVGVDPPIPLDEKHGDKCQLDQVVDFGTDLACSVRPAKGWLRDLMISILDRHLILDSNLGFTRSMFVRFLVNTTAFRHHLFHQLSVEAKSDATFLYVSSL